MITENSVSSEEIIINAPAAVVWDVIVDFANYGLWNSFCPGMKGELVMGAPLEMQVDMGNGLQQQVEYITRIDPPHTIVWSMENKPGDPIHADRTQRIEPIDATSCRYFSIDEFSGEFAGPMIEQLGRQVEKGFNDCAAGLKARAREALPGRAGVADGKEHLPVATARCRHHGVIPGYAVGHCGAAAACPRRFADHGQCRRHESRHGSASARPPDRPWQSMSAAVALWQDCLDRRAPIEACLSETCHSITGYLVTESVLQDFDPVWEGGERRPGITQFGANGKPENVTDDEFYHNWQVVHSTSSFDLHPRRWSYVRHAVARPLTTGAPPYRAIVSEHFRELADFTDNRRYFGSEQAVADMLRELPGFCDFNHMVSVPMSEYFFR
ncbi:MAG: SRPBCC domain-containing protein [Halioglobus sp.]